jgi:unsaturated rhamnogalacturonyl hydrolase
MFRTFSAAAAVLFLAGVCTADPALTREDIRGAASDQASHFGDSPNNPGPIATDLDASLRPAAVKQVMRKVADWQLARARPYFNQQWTFGALYTGMMAAYQSTGDIRFRDAMVGMGEQFGWDIDRGAPSGGAAALADDQNEPPPPPPRPRDFPLNANSECQAQTYLELFLQYQHPWMLDPTREAFDDIININEYPSRSPGGARDQGVQNQTNPHRIIWWWCDALFMGPPAWARLYKATGDEKYLDYMNHHWWLTSQYLYDPAEHLYFRDASFIAKHEANGKKVFWSRGNGWVIGGLVRVLQYLTADHPDRPKYIAQFKEMMERIAAIQGDDGLWRAGMLDPDSYGLPENSGSAFFTYGMAWGINEGILDRATYQPVAEKAWRGLLSHIYADGRLGCIQQTGAGPGHFKPSSSYVYGVGAFLLAGREINRLAIAQTMGHHP